MSTSPDRPKRRSQATRRREMRERLLDATIACLVEDGYAGTSTTRISQRAGVSRGAQLHHFPTREDLMLAAVEHVFERRRAAFRAATADLEPGRAGVTEALRHMWTAVSGDASHAWLELAVAARTDAALRERVVETTERLRATAAEELARLDGAGALPPGALTLASAAMDGLVLQQLAGLDDGRRDEALELLGALARLAGGGR